MVRAVAPGVSWRQRAEALAVLAAMALVVLDAGLLNIALPTIANSLGETPARTVLAVTAYQAALLVGLLPCAHLAERWGYRRLFVAGLAAFLGASILCAAATSLAALVAARILQGLGGAAIMALGIALLRFALGPERLGAAIGWNAMTVALCTAAAPMLGAAILASTSWPWLFLVKLPLGAIALAASVFLPTVDGTRRGIDGPAILLHGAVAVLALVAAQTAVAHPLASALLAAAALLFAMLMVRRARSRPGPLWPLDLLAIRPFRIAVAGSVCCFAGQSAGLLALSFHLQLGAGQGPARAALALTCWPLAVAATGPFADRLSRRLGSARLCTAGGIALGAGLLVSALAPAGAGSLPAAVGAAIAGLGFGLFQVPNNRTMFLLAPAARSAAAGGVQGSARLLGQTLGALVVGLLLACWPPAAAARGGLALAALFALLAALVSAFALPPGRDRTRPALRERRI